jgi:hypothetical protein
MRTFRGFRKFRRSCGENARRGAVSPRRREAWMCPGRARRSDAHTRRRARRDRHSPVPRRSHPRTRRRVVSRAKVHSRVVGVHRASGNKPHRLGRGAGNDDTSTGAMSNPDSVILEEEMDENYEPSQEGTRERAIRAAKPARRRTPRGGETRAPVPRPSRDVPFPFPPSPRPFRRDATRLTRPRSHRARRDHRLRQMARHGPR